jgi:hypothetical protein
MPPPACRPGHREGPPGAAPRCHEALPPFPSLSGSLALSPVHVPQSTRNCRHGRRLLPLLEAALSSADLPGSSASPPSSSPSKESTRDGQNLRRRCRFPCRHRAPPPSIASPSDLPCCLRPARKAQGEPLVRPDHLPFSLSLCLVVPTRLRRAGRRQTWQGQVLTGRLTRPAWPARVETGVHPSVTLGQLDPGTESLHTLF